MCAPVLRWGGYGEGGCTCGAGTQALPAACTTTRTRSTLVGDIAEVKALKSVFTGDTSHIKMNATKSLIGHCLGAAGGMEAIATIKVRGGGEKGAWGHGWAGLLWACLHVACLRTEASGRRGAPKFAAALCSCSRHFLSVLNGLLQCVSRTEHRGAGSVNCACRCVHAYVHACACMAESVHVQVSVAMCIGWSC